MEGTGQVSGRSMSRPEDFDADEPPQNGTRALRHEPRTGVGQTGSCRRYPVLGWPICCGNEQICAPVDAMINLLNFTHTTKQNLLMGLKGGGKGWPSPVVTD